MPPKNVLAWMPESSSFRTSFRSQLVHVSQTLLNSTGHHLHPNFAVIQHTLRQETSLLVRSKIVGVFGNTLAGDHMYSRHNWGKFSQLDKILLSQKGKTFSWTFIAYLESPQNFGRFGEKSELYRLNSSEGIDSEKCGCLNARELLFQNTLREPKCPRVPNTAELCRASPLSHFAEIEHILSQKTSVLVRSEIVGVFRNTLTVGHMYSRHN